MSREGVLCAVAFRKTKVGFLQKTIKINYEKKMKVWPAMRERERQKQYSR